MTKIERRFPDNNIRNVSKIKTMLVQLIGNLCKVNTDKTHGHCKLNEYEDTCRNEIHTSDSSYDIHVLPYFQLYCKFCDKATVGVLVTFCD